MRAALDAQNQLLFWFEARVVSRDHAACRMVAGAIAGRRQENMLRQRNTSFTRGLHRRRVALARPEAIPSWRHGVVSAAEAATLWQLPSPRIGHIRLARHTIPRAPAPPDIARAPIARAGALAERGRRAARRAVARGRRRPRRLRLPPAQRARRRRARRRRDRPRHRRGHRRRHPARLCAPSRGQALRLRAHRQPGNRQVHRSRRACAARGPPHPAADAWDAYATSAIFDGEGWWSEPLRWPLTCALDDQGRIVPAPVRRLYRQRVRESGRRVTLSDGSRLTVPAVTGCADPRLGPTLAEGDTVCVPRRLDWPGAGCPASSWSCSPGSSPRGASVWYAQRAANPGRSHAA